MLYLWETHHMTGMKRGAASALRKVIVAARRSDVRDMVLIGAGALSAYGAPRYSEDIDLLLSHSDARRLAKALLDDGFKGPRPSSDVFLYHFASPAGMEVDLLGATEPLYLDAIASARAGKFLGLTVPVPSPEFFALLKLRAAEGDPDRELRHLGDIQDLARVSALKLDFVRRYVRAKERDLLPYLTKLTAARSRARK
jgi:hypothetical protein